MNTTLFGQDISVKMYLSVMLKKVLSIIIIISFYQVAYSQNLNNEPILNKFSYSFKSNIDQIEADQIKNFVSNRKGVINCDVDIINKKISIELDSSLNRNSFNYILISVREKFLDEIDHPVYKTCDHK